MMSHKSTTKEARRCELRFKGVRKRKWGKWVSEIRLPNSRERIWLGSYDAPEKAARAFDAALFCLRGSKAKFNFPQNPPEIQGASSFNRQEIQVAAARFANENPVPRDSFAEGSSSRLESSMVELLQSCDSHDSSSFTEDHSVQIESPMVDFFGSSDSHGNSSGYDFFLPLDDFPGDYFPIPSTDFSEDNGASIFAPQSFLWNF